MRTFPLTMDGILKLEQLWIVQLLNQQSACPSRARNVPKRRLMPKYVFLVCDTSRALSFAQFLSCWGAISQLCSCSEWLKAAYSCDEQWEFRSLETRLATPLFLPSPRKNSRLSRSTCVVEWQFLSWMRLAFRFSLLLNKVDYGINRSLLHIELGTLVLGWSESLEPLGLLIFDFLQWNLFKNIIITARHYCLPPSGHVSNPLLGANRIALHNVLCRRRLKF